MNITKMIGDAIFQSAVEAHREERDGASLKARLHEGLVLRTARKSHNCNGDGSQYHRKAEGHKNIETGEKYIECYWESSPYSSGSRICMACAKAFYGV